LILSRVLKNTINSSPRRGRGFGRGGLSLFAKPLKPPANMDEITLSLILPVQGRKSNFIKKAFFNTLLGVDHPIISGGSAIDVFGRVNGADLGNFA
jgi:hypothetical protein